MLARYYRELLNHFTQAVRDRDGAADLVQETYVRVLALQGTDELIREPRALLYRTARNLLIDRHRRSEVRAAHAAPATPDIEQATADVAAPAAHEPDVAAASAQGVKALLATIENLPPRCRQAFLLHKFEGLSHTEVAAHMGISRSAVEQHLKHALEACRRCRDGQDGRTQASPGVEGD